MVRRRFSSGCKSQPAIAPAGSNRSSNGGDGMAEAFGITCHELVNLDFRCGSTPEVRGVARNVCCWGTSGRKSAESRHCRPNVSCWGYNGSQSRTLESPFVAISRLSLLLKSNRTLAHCDAGGGSRPLHQERTLSRRQVGLAPDRVIVVRKKI